MNLDSAPDSDRDNFRIALNTKSLFAILLLYQLVLPSYQEEGKEVVEMKPGDCINIPVGVKHWHGAAPDSWFSHLAIEVPGENASNEWLEAVDDKIYLKMC